MRLRNHAPRPDAAGAAAPHRGRTRRWLVPLSGVVALSLTAAACGSGSATSAGSSGGGQTASGGSGPGQAATSGGSGAGKAATSGGSGAGKGAVAGAATTIKRGGSLTVLEGKGFAGNWPGLDPATDTSGAANQSYMDAIYGQLFDLSTGGKLEPDLATGYHYSNGGKTITIELRKGIRFSDGTPFNAEAVVWNWKRDLKSDCTCKPVFNQKAPPVIKAVGPHAVSITLQYVDAAFIHGLQDDIFSWIASPTAVRTMGEKAFALKPVGAGPFVVVRDVPSSELVLKRNPHYFRKGLPYLDGLVFKTVANDQSALVAMQAGSGDAYEGMSTPQLKPAFAKQFQVTTEPSTSPYDIQLNTSIPPFNNLKARQAIYYAINCPLLNEKLFGNQEPCGESFEAPAGLFYTQHVPGYLHYDPAKAKQLVKELGGLRFSFFTISSPVALSLMEALQTEFQAVGMKVDIAQYDLSTLIGQFTGQKWQTALQTAGAWDPATGVGVAFRFASTSPFSGVHSPKLDSLLSEAAGTTSPKQRKAYYDAAAKYIAKNALGPFLFPINGYDIAIHGAGAPGLTTPLPSVAVAPEVLWQYAYNNNH